MAVLARGRPGAQGPLARVRRLFLTGLVIILPLLITIWLLRALFILVHGISTPFILRVLSLMRIPLVDDPSFTTYFAPLIGVLLTALLVLLVGGLTTNFLGRRIVSDFDRLMLRIPLIKGIYGPARQLLDALNRKTNTFQKVVMVEYPRPGVYTLGFLARQNTTLRSSGERRGLPGYSLVFLPTTPNPTSGWLAAVPDRDVIPLDMSLEDGIKTIVSGGIVLPPDWERS